MKLAWPACLALLCGAAGPVAAQSPAGGVVLRPSLQLARVPYEGPSATPSHLTSSTELLSQVAKRTPTQGQCDNAGLASDEVLSLTRALEIVMCRSPGLGQAMAGVREQAAGVDLAALAWRPQWNAFVERDTNRIPVSNNGAPAYAESLTGGIGLSWLLFDFGARSADLEAARQSLASAMANQNSAALNTVLQALKLYVDASTAWAKLGAATDAETLALQTADAARAKYAAKVGSLSDKLQAETALAQARLDRVQAKGNWQAAAASLAIAMGADASTTITLPSPAQSFADLADQPLTVAEMQAARDQHPRVLAAQADLRATQARLESVRDAGKGSINMTGSLAATRALGAGGSTTSDHPLTASIVASVPLFNGADQKARSGQVVAQIEAREAAVTQAQQEVETTLVTAVQQLDIQQQAEAAARVLLDAATQGHQMALGRYKAGVASMLELLQAQQALAGARSQLLQAHIARANAQISLAIAAGRFGTPSVVR